MAETIVGRFWERVGEHPERVALRHKSDGGWRDVTWQGYGDITKRAAKGLLALGFSHADKMSLLSHNRPEWFYVDVACMSLGGTTAPIYVTNSADQVAYVIEHSESKVAIVEDSEQLEKVLKMRSELPALEKVIVFDGYDGDADGDFVMTWDELLASGKDVDDSKFDAALGSVTPDDLATFVYTSGTTGPPKAVMLSHSNIWWTASHSQQQIPIADAEKGRALSYLPLSHIAERMISHMLQIYYGTQTWFAGSIETLLEDLKECEPTYFFGVPRVWEKFYAGIQAKMAQADPDDRKTKLAKKAIALGRTVTEAEQEAVRQGGKMTDAKLGLGARLQHALLDKLVLHKVRSAIGLGQCELSLSAAAPINSELLWFFHSIGLKIAEGYGQSEDTGPTTWNPPDAILIGTVGPALPGMEVKIAEDGEILARGGNVTKGYYKNEEATKELLDNEGWMRSGDVGKLDGNGYLMITDRKKDLIITAGGKNIAPQEIENKIKFHDLISQAVVIGDRRPFLTAIITLDEEKAPGWAKEHGVDASDVAGIAGDERTLKEIEAAINEVNNSLARVEGVKKFRVLDRDFLEEENEITPTLKVKRKQIGENYNEHIEEMYRKDSPSSAPMKAPQRK
ncbi:MAG: AMP-dependent synthetase/ligase [Actinomycetota bacterium]